MNQVLLRIILSLLNTFPLTVVVGQNLSYNPDTLSPGAEKIVAIRSAIEYLNARLSNKDLAVRFIVDSNSGSIVCKDDKTFFSSTNAYCQPVGYEIPFRILLKNRTSWDTLDTNLALPLESDFTISKDSSAGMWSEDLLKAWEKVITNKYKINYEEILVFIKRKGLHDYSIGFWYEDFKYQPNGKIFWYVSGRNGKTKNKSYFSYRIDPETGSVKVKKLVPQIEFPDSH